MKRIITIVLYISILCGCGGIQGLRIHNEQLPPGKQEIDGGIYYNTKEKGHNSDVKHKLMNQDGFSIIIPVFNSQKTLYRCLESVINQTFSDFEVIIVDNASTDDSMHIAKKFAH